MNSLYREHFRAAEAAADWLVRLESEGAGCHDGFAAWLKESPQNVHEFLAVSAWSKRVHAMNPSRPMDVHGELQRQTSAVVEMLPVQKVKQSEPRRRVWLLAAAVAIFALAATLGVLQWGTMHDATYTTALGEQRSFKLPDGSLIHLNTRSRVNLDFSSQTRDVRLLDGEALFVVARDTTRPFRVITRTAVVQALGTQFNVRQTEESTVVSVVEGRVRVSETVGKGSASPATLEPGEQARVSPEGPIVKRTHGDAAAAVAWRQRRLVFRDDRLADVAAEFNRYNETQIVVEGEALRSRQLTGAFDADSPQSLLLFFDGDESVAIERTPGRVLIRPE